LSKGDQAAWVGGLSSLSNHSPNRTRTHSKSSHFNPSHYSNSIHLSSYRKRQKRRGRSQREWGGRPAGIKEVHWGEVEGPTTTTIIISETTTSLNKGGSGLEMRAKVQFV